MQTMKCAMLVWIASASIAAPASAALTTTVAETFDGTIDQAAWRLGTLDEIVSDGGSPGAYLRNRSFDAAVPLPVYVGALPTPFFGDYRAAGVASLGLDVNVFAASIGVDHTRSIALVLSSDMGTPDDPADDCEVWFAGRKPLPSPGTGWRAYDFRVPSDSAALPPGWKVNGTCGNLSDDAAWNRVITDVTRVSFPFSEPGIFWYFQVWDLGIDSIRISLAAAR